MAYTTLDDIGKILPEEVLVQLTDDEALGQVNQARVDEAIARADAEIDAYCGGRYAVPFSTVPELVRTLSAEMAVYHLFGRRVQEMPEARRDRYRGTVRQLEAIARGAISLGVAPAPSSADSQAETSTPTDENLFSRDRLRGF
jgi:phage gp36-like protein